MSKRRWPREPLEPIRIEEEAAIQAVHRAGSGGVSAEVLVVGAFEIGGRKYTFNRVITISAKAVNLNPQVTE